MEITSGKNRMNVMPRRAMWSSKASADQSVTLKQLRIKTTGVIRGVTAAWSAETSRFQ